MATRHQQIPVDGKKMFCFHKCFAWHQINLYQMLCLLHRKTNSFIPYVALWEGMASQLDSEQGNMSNMCSVSAISWTKILILFDHMLEAEFDHCKLVMCTLRILLLEGRDQWKLLKSFTTNFCWEFCHIYMFIFIQNKIFGFLYQHFSDRTYLFSDGFY